MRRLDELHLNYPFAGSRMLRDFLRAEGVEIGRGRVTTLTTDFCFEAVEEALAKHGKPEIFNTDQGSQFAAPRCPSGHLGRRRRPDGRQPHRDQHGRQGILARQRLCREAVALGEVRGGLPQGL